MFNEFRTGPVEIHSAARLANSASGVPRWKLQTSEGPWTTQTNTHLNHIIEELSQPGDSQLIGKPGRLVTLVHTRSKAVVALEALGKQYR